MKYEKSPTGKLVRCEGAKMGTDELAVNAVRKICPISVHVQPTHIRTQHAHTDTRNEDLPLSLSRSLRYYVVLLLDWTTRRPEASSLGLCTEPLFGPRSDYQTLIGPCKYRIVLYICMGVNCVINRVFSDFVCMMQTIYIHIYI